MMTGVVATWPHSRTVDVRSSRGFGRHSAIHAPRATTLRQDPLSQNNIRLTSVVILACFATRRSPVDPGTLHDVAHFAATTR